MFVYVVCVELKAKDVALGVGELADSSVNLIVRVWSSKDDYWPIKFDLTKAFKEAFDRNGITIPFPQRELHYADKTAAE